VSRPDDEAWRQIVDNYGEEPEFPEVAPAEEAAPEDAPADEPSYDLEDEGFVPPEPPPLPRPHGVRLAAWIGVFGVPLALLLSVVAGISLPAIVSTALVVWFLAGFGYLVWQMPKQRDDPWDDGARL